MAKTHKVIADEMDNVDVDTMWNTFRFQLQRAVDKFVPHRIASTRDRPPWVTPELKKLIRSRDHLYKKVKNRPTDLRKEKLKLLKKRIRKAIQRDYWSYTEAVLTENDTNGNNKKLWTFIKHKKTDSIDTAPLKENGVLKDATREKAEILNTQFSSVFNTDSPNDFPNDRSWQEDLHYPNITATRVSFEGVHKLLHDLNPYKAMGLDSLHPQLLKQLAPTIAPILQIIFQKSLDTGVVPSD